MKRNTSIIRAIAFLLSIAAVSCTQEVRTYNLENEVVRKFMSKGPYSGFGTDESYFSNREEFPDRYAWDKPSHVIISWKGFADQEYTVTVMEGKGKDAVPFFVDKKVKGQMCTLTNLVPQRYYSYVVKHDGKTIDKGAFRTEGLVRMVEIENSCNARDLGGWTGLDGRKVKYGWLFRTGSIDGNYEGISYEFCGGDRCRNELHEAAQSQIGDPARYTLSERSLQQLAQIGIKADLDLRGVTNEGMWGNQCITHSRSLQVTKIPGADFCQIMTDQALHTPFDNDAIIRDVAWMIEELKKGNPVAFHCRSGADRTGALAMLVEALLGMQAGDIARDYELTSLSSEGTGQTRSAKSVINSGYGFYGRGFTTLEVNGTDPEKRLQQQSYKYLNSFFPECSIPAEDLDWFIDFMLEPAV